LTAPAAAAARGFSAKPEGRTGEEVVVALAKLGCSGTLYLEGRGGALLLVLARGRIATEFGLSPLASLDQVCTHLCFRPLTAEGGALPQLPSRAPGSPVAALRALPDLAQETRLETGLFDFRALLARYQERGLSGALTVRAGEEEGLVLLYKGQLQAAAYGRENRVASGAQALRSMYRQVLPDVPESRLGFHRLEPALVAALSGLAQERALGAASPELGTFTGIEVGKRGYLFYASGRPYLLIEAQTIGPPRLYQALVGGEPLALPDKPTGWEKRSYRLTLRGHDALNPMTDLYSTFTNRYGPAGVQLLRALHASAATGELALRLGVDEEELRALVERLESDGLIRGR
jgi:hypothetical protein